MLGRLVEARRFPVKSVLGEMLADAPLVAPGIDGDRSHALIDAVSGLGASAKQPRQWAARDGAGYFSDKNLREREAERELVSGG
jgi:uncharacterized protein YcbX